MAYNELSDVNRGRIVGMMEAGLNQTDVAQRLNIARSTVRFWWNRWQNQGNVDRIPRSGRPTLASPRILQTVKLSIQRNPWQSYSRIRNENLCLRHLSRRTVNRYALNMNFHARRPLQRIPLGVYHRRNRLQWCNFRQNMTVSDWSSIIFSDESRFTLDFNDGRLLVRRLPGTRFQNNLIAQHDRYGAGSIMVWGAISFNSRSDLVIINGKLNAHRYIDEILRPIALPFLNRDEATIYQQDNARPHSARITKHFLAESKMPILEWPARSPDLSIIEHVWDILGRRLESEYDNPPYSMNILRNRLLEQWNLISQSDIQNLYRSMPARLLQCIQRRGGHTHY